MRVIINGFPEEISEFSTIANIIHGNQEFEIHMIAELNHRFIHQNDYEITFLKEGDALELIHAAFGG
jgi:thiamine biosynthesis protein ThiS